LLDELKEAHDEERRMNAEITKLRLQLDETSSAVDFAKKDSKKLSGATGAQSFANNFKFYASTKTSPTIVGEEHHVFGLCVRPAVRNG